MGKIILVTGGARSGKSTFAEKLAAEYEQESGRAEPGDVLYIAAATPFDEEMKDRIAKHRNSRPARWDTLERYKGFDQVGGEPAFIRARVLLLECLSVMLNNLIFEDRDFDPDHATTGQAEEIERRMLAELSALISYAEGKRLIMVTNEVGMGIVPENKLARLYRDMLGRVNRYAAESADEVYFVVSGIPMKVK